MRPAAPKRVPWNKGKLTGGKATAATQTRLVDPDEAPDRRPRSRPRHPGRGCCCQWIHGGPSNGPTEKTGRPVRFELSEQTRQAIGRGDSSS